MEVANILSGIEIFFFLISVSIGLFYTETGFFIRVSIKNNCCCCCKCCRKCKYTYTKEYEYKDGNNKKTKREVFDLYEDDECIELLIDEQNNNFSSKKRHIKTEDTVKKYNINASLIDFNTNHIPMNFDGFCINYNDKTFDTFKNIFNGTDFKDTKRFLDGIQQKIEDNYVNNQLTIINSLTAEFCFLVSLLSDIPVEKDKRCLNQISILINKINQHIHYSNIKIGVLECYEIYEKYIEKNNKNEYFRKLEKIEIVRIKSRTLSKRRNKQILDERKQILDERDQRIENLPSDTEEI